MIHIFFSYIYYFALLLMLLVIQCVRFYSDEVKRLPFQKFFEYFEHFNFMKKLHSVQFFFQKIIVFAWILKIL